MDTQTENSNEVNITITAPSDNEVSHPSSDEEEDDEYIYSDDDDHCESLSGTSDSNEKENSKEITESENEEKEDQATKEDEEKLCENLESVSVNEEKPAIEEKEGKNGDQQAYEIVGDRVLVEKDGKFELVDANEIKAEYFEMLGLKSEEGSTVNAAKNPEVSPKVEDERVTKVKERPKTTPVGGTRSRESPQRTKRAQSSWGGRSRNSEYANIRSPYGLTEKQLEIKRKREEAIARRKKEEEEMAKEEEKRRREDAERAFQAWLHAKKEEEKERRRATQNEEKEEDDMKAQESEKAYKAWKTAKRKQQKEEQQEARVRMEETASMYVVHDRDSCEEAFKRWLKKKKEANKLKEAEKKKKRPKSKRKPKEPLPINSDKIRFTDNYGYRNTVVY